MSDKSIPNNKLKRRSFLDEIDKKILNSMQKDCRKPVLELAKELDIPKSTITYRIKRLEEEGIIEGYHAKVNASKLGEDIQMIVNVRAKYGPGYHDKVGKALSEIPGVWAVYFVYGESDFFILARSKNREELFEKMKALYNSNDIERSTTLVVGKTIKEDPRIFFDVYNRKN